MEQRAEAIYRVIVNIKDLIDEVTAASEDTQTGLGNAMHRFLAASKEMDAFNVQRALTDKAKETEDKGKKARISELRAVYQAMLHGLVTEGKGYLRVVKEARELLRKEGILPSGAAKRSAEELRQAKKVRFQKKALEDGVPAAQLEEAWANEEAKEVSQDTVNTIAEDFVNNLIGDGYDFVAIRRILTAARALLEESKKAATL